ncbi:50S ribosomal protein L29 [Blattabacterium cuenoti]|uniref:50S ribosomal protein L29 n=1 Tax=Blattabacterium cuenoti TaxID=1653831 RepID=UPI00163BBC40|nr:50S ribosomal protein L29 [Blattabacterium cuenoti]
MKNSEIKTLSIKDLIQKISVDKNTFQKMKFSHSIKNQKNPLLIRILRKRIAQLKTELNRKIINDKKK